VQITEIYFEKENIYTFDSKGELLITIMSSLAQEESRSLSENVTWGQRKRFSDGKVRMNYKRFLGYEKGEDGKPVVNEEEAEIVRLIYRLFLNGKTPCGICRELERMGIPTVSGKPKWSQSTVHSILTNEKYKGDALLQKKFTVAQEESRSISENITWGQRKSFSDGKVHMPYKRFLGYEKGEDGKPVVNEDEAKIVRLIYRLFLEGKTSSGICKYLESMSIPSPGGKQKWTKTTITSILTNEKYKGDALLQKKFTVDFLEKKMKINEGEVPQYYVKDSHQPIIDPNEWELVQTEIARRKALGKSYSGKSVFSAKLVCECCGSFYGSKVWHSTDKYRRTIWQCNNKFNGERCKTPIVDTETIQNSFIKAYNQLMSNQKHIIEDCEIMRKSLVDFKTLDEEIEKYTDEINEIAELVRILVKENASTAQQQDVYNRKYNALNERYETALAELKRLHQTRAFREQQDKAMLLFIRTLKKQPKVIESWDATIWTVMIEKAIIHKNGSIKFVFYNGTEITVEV